MPDRHAHSPLCQDLLAQLSDYIDGQLEATLCASIERHLAGCHDCRVLVDTTRKTVALFRQQRRANLPPGLTGRLWQALDQAGCLSKPND